MTVTEHIIDLVEAPTSAGADTSAAPRPRTIGPQPTEQTRRKPRAEEGSPLEGRHAHLLRLSLDLQLDAMLLTLGAAAAQDVESPKPGQAAVAPWFRWLAEDVDMTRTLAATALIVDTALPSTLGAPRAHADPVRMADDLLARYESMSELLRDLLERARPGDGRAWRTHVRRALGRCVARIEELRGHRDDLAGGCGSGTGVGGGTGAGSGIGARRSAMDQHRFLPGELLG